MKWILLVLFSSLLLTSLAADGDYFVYSETNAINASLANTLSRQSASIGVIANYTVVLGGSLRANENQFNNFIHFSNGTWGTFKTDNYHQSGACSSQPYQTDILTIFGGMNGTDNTPSWTMATFNVTSLTLTKIEPVPSDIPVMNMACASSPNGSSFYVFGGKCEPTCSGILYEYYNNKWTSLNSTGPALLGATLVIHNDFLYVFGGFSDPQGTASNATWKFSLKEKIWCSDTTTVRPLGRAYHSAALDVEKNVFFIYGGTPTPFLTVDPIVFSDTWYYNMTSNNWTQVNLTTAPPARFSHSQVFHEGRSLIFGGRNTSGALSDLWQFVPLWNCNDLNCANCLSVVGCGWCSKSGKCVSGNDMEVYVSSTCSNEDFSRQARVCLPSPWTFTPWWIAFSLVLLVTCSGVFVFIGKTFCCPDPPAESYEAVN